MISSIHHTTLIADDLAKSRAFYEDIPGLQVAYTRSRSGRCALFCRDPDQNALEFVESPNAG